MKPVTDNAKPTLYSMVICPFAQRTRIHLALKGVPFELKNLDICAPRPGWFLEMNRSGQVPVLVNGKDVIADSSLVSEYIEETFTGNCWFGARPAERARLRSLINYVDRSFVPALYILMAAATPEERADRIAKALETWAWLDDFLARQNYDGGFLGDDFGMAEICIAPFFLRYEVVAYYQDWSLPDDARFDKVCQWQKTILAQDIVCETAEPIPDLIKMYEDYTFGYFNGAVPPGQSYSSLDLSIPLATRPMPERARSVKT